MLSGVAAPFSFSSHHRHRFSHSLHFGRVPAIPNSSNQSGRIVGGFSQHSFEESGTLTEHVASNGIDLEMLELEDFTEDMVYDDSGTDYLFNRVAIKGLFIVNGQSEVAS